MLHYENTSGPFLGGLVLVGERQGDEALSQVRSFVDGSNFPVLYAQGAVVDVLAQLQGYTAKLNVDDPDRALAVVNHYEKHIDFEALLGAL